MEREENVDKLIDCFVQTFAIEPGRVVPALEYQSIPEWDSVGHMALVAEIENQFDVTLDTDDIIGMSSVAKAIEILAKHGATLSAA
ncbi:MAG: acyl carrier protein [Leptothrix sp. (in: Bacteria)]|nr:acyl carrier protein [Leptothrix sp. (in: b-proteobacteria)]